LPLDVDILARTPCPTDLTAVQWDDLPNREGELYKDSELPRKWAIV